MKSGGRKERINMIAGYQDGKLIAPFTIQGGLVTVWCLKPGGTGSSPWEISLKSLDDKRFGQFIPPSGTRPNQSP
jgi:hypothetical protein